MKQYNNSQLTTVSQHTKHMLCIEKSSNEKYFIEVT